MKKVSDKIASFVIGLVTYFAVSNPVFAQTTGPVILDVVGTSANTAEIIEFDRSMLEEIEQVEIQTVTPWTEGDITFSGVLLRNLFMLDDNAAGLVRAIALNDYAVDIPLDDILNYDVIVAVQRDGEYLTVRDKGPLWVIYPWSDVPALRTEVHYSRSIWQLRRLELVAE